MNQGQKDAFLNFDKGQLQIIKANIALNDTFRKIFPKMAITTSNQKYRRSQPMKQIKKQR